jgi:hypothetical protein
MVCVCLSYRGTSGLVLVVDFCVLDVGSFLALILSSVFHRLVLFLMLEFLLVISVCVLVVDIPCYMSLSFTSNRNLLYVKASVLSSTKPRRHTAGEKLEIYKV